MNTTPIPKPSGIEAAVCEDIARRQQVGIAKYGVTVADNPLGLLAWLRHAYEESLDLPIYLRRCIAELEAGAKLPDIGATVAAVQAAAKSKRQYTYMGRQVSISDLANMAGCDWNCMNQRLRHRTPEESVAMGPPGASGVHRGPRLSVGPRTAAATQAKVATAKRFAYKGEQLTAAELAVLAGITPHQMQLRLRSKSAEAAVALGAARPRVKRTPPPPAAPATAQAPKAAAPRLTKPVNAAVMPPKQQRPFNPTAEVIVPANVKRTVAPTPPERFAVHSAPSHFSGRRPGQYDADAEHTPLARTLANPRT